MVGRVFQTDAPHWQAGVHSPIDMVLPDVLMLPTPSGFTVCGEIKANPEPQTPLIPVNFDYRPLEQNKTDRRDLKPEQTTSWTRPVDPHC